MSEVQLIVKAGAISPTLTHQETYIQAANGQNYFETGVVPPIAPYYPNGSKVEFYNNTTASVEFTTYVVSTDDSTNRVYINPPFGTAPDENDGIDIFCYGFIGTNTFLDLYPNESISLSYQFTDLNNFSQIGTFSRDFRIPASKRNVEALGALYDYNFVDDVLSFSRKYEAELRVDTIPISRGYLRVMAAYKQQDYLSDFQVAFYSEAPNFVKEIGEKKLADITDLATMNEPMAFNNVTTMTSKRIWALIDRAISGQALSDAGETNTQPTQNANNPLRPSELTPCLRADYLLTEIFKDAGFELDATNLLNIIQDYYIPWVITENIITVENADAIGFTVYNSTSFSYANYNAKLNFTTALYGGANFDFPNDRFVNTSASNVTCTFTFEANDVFGNFSYKVYNASNVLQSTITIGSAGSAQTDEFGNLYLTVGNILNTSPQIMLASGWYIEVFAANYLEYSVVALKLNTAVFENAEIIYSFNAPDIKQIDFVSDLIKMHNLAVIPDPSVENKLKLEPMTTFIGSGTTLDWSKKLDISKDIVIKGTDDLRKSKLTFTYSAGQDTYSKLFVDQGRIYGDYKPEPYVVTSTQIPSTFAQGETTVKLVAQSTPATLVSSTNLIAPRFWTQSGGDPPKFTSPGLRFLYWSDTQPIYLYDVTGTPTSVYQNVPIVTHYSDTSGANPDYNNLDLNFAPETPLHDYTANPFYNLFTLYWRDYLDTIYSDDARIMEASFALDNTDILTLNFGDYIFVKDAYWRVLELSDYKMGQYESTRVKLLKMNPGAPPVARCDLKPDSVNADGSINFLNLAGNPVSATETCCLAYGYTWNAGMNLCYARPSDRPSITNGTSVSSERGIITNNAPINSGINNIVNTVGLDAGSSTYSIYSGQTLKNEGGNDYTIMVGDVLILKGDQRGAALFGKSVESVVPGLVIGGGWTQDDRTYAYNGSQSAGTFLMSAQGTYAATLGTVELFIEGIANKRIEMADEMLWYMRMHVMVQPTINQYINATITAQMGKTGGIAFATAPVVQYQDTSMAGRTVNLIIDTATNTAQHRVNIQLAGGTYPFVTRLLAEINYTQFR
jgi:hypothetical protein